MRVFWLLTFLLNAFIKSQFPFVPISWMFHSRKLNYKINNTYERALRLVYKDYNYSFNDLLVKDNFFRVHHSILHKLIFVIFEVNVNIAPEGIPKSYERYFSNNWKIRIHSDMRLNLNPVPPRAWNSIQSEVKKRIRL